MESAETRDHPIQMNLREYVDLAIAKAVPETARVILAEHKSQCPAERMMTDMGKTDLAAMKLDDRVKKIEIKFAALIGLMIGSGALGGTVSGTLIHILNR